jgi:mannitol-1-/sugar-/sorbitol-6-phosphatase
VGEHRSRLIERLAGVRALLLDMDGTLVDSDAAVERAWTSWCAEYGIDATPVLAIAHGVPADQTVRGVRPDASDGEVAAAAARRLELQYGDLDDVVSALGAAELLALLGDHGVPWAVVTSADRRLASARLGAVGIAAPVVITVEDVAVGKPDPAGYQLAAERLGVPVDRSLVVEDTAPGVEAGRRAGALTAGLRGLVADVAVTDLAELAALLAEAWHAEATAVPIPPPAT